MQQAPLINALANLQGALPGGDLAASLGLANEFTLENGGLAGLFQQRLYRGDIRFFHFLFQNQDIDDTRNAIQQYDETTLTAGGQKAAATKSDKQALDSEPLELSPEELAQLIGVPPQTWRSIVTYGPLTFESTQGSNRTPQDNDAFEIDFNNVFKPQDFSGHVQLAMQHLPSHLQNQLQANNTNSTGFAKSEGLSKDFVEMLQKAHRKHQPVRVTINDDTALILKFTKNGQVSAHFLTTAANEAQLKQQLIELRQRLEAKGLPVDQLMVSTGNQQQQRRQDERSPQHDPAS